MKSKYNDQGFSARYQLFTYDPTENGIDSFDCPFTISDKGTLCNWWAGGENVCDTLTKLLGSGIFARKPYHDGIGYLFRKNVPRLIFVFTNEFDNSISTTYTNTDGVTSTNNVVVFGTKNGDKTVWVNLYNSMTSESGEYIGNDAPDPYCIRILKEADGDAIREYLKKIGVLGDSDPSSDAFAAYSFLKSRLVGIPHLRYAPYKNGSTFTDITSGSDIASDWKFDYKVGGGSANHTTKFGQWDLNGMDRPFGSAGSNSTENTKVAAYLADGQVEFYNTNARF